MPVINVSVPAGHFNESTKVALIAELTDILMEVEGTKGIPVFAAGTWLLYNERVADSLAVGGKLAPARYHVSIDIPVGALSLQQKEAVIVRMTDAILRAEGIEPDATHRARVYCLINEIADGGWGFAGQSYTREKINQLRQSLAQAKP